MGVANCSSEELETSFFHIFTHGIGFVWGKERSVYESVG